MDKRPENHETLILSFGAGERKAARDAAELDRGSHRTIVGGSRATAPDETLPGVGDVIAGNYRLVERLGAGTFGSVFVAERTDVPEHRVALKLVERAVFDGRDVNREMVMLAAIHHPHVVQLKDHGFGDNYVWLTMPLFEGETLAERLERGPLSLGEAHKVFLPIARGIEALHARGLRHQDIKPENIFLARLTDGIHPVLLDLGVAVEKDSTFVAGTPLFAAPEQLIMLDGPLETEGVSEKIDTYGFGATALYALIGEAAFPGSEAITPFDVAQSFEEREQAPLRDGVLPDVSASTREELQTLFGRLLEREPSNRPTMSDVAESLDAFLLPERDAAARIEATLSRQAGSLRAARVVGALMLAAGAVGGFIAYGQRETFRLAAELRRAQKAGAESFDRLDTCAAAHHSAKNDVTALQERLRTNATAHAAAQKKAVREGVNHALEVRAAAYRTQLAKLNERIDSETEKRRTSEADAARVQLANEAERKSVEAKLTKLEAQMAELSTAAERHADDLATARSKATSAVASNLECEASTSKLRSEVTASAAKLAECRSKTAAQPPTSPAAPPKVGTAGTQGSKSLGPQR